MTKELTILKTLQTKIKALTLIKDCIIYGDGTLFDKGNKSPICILSVLSGLSIASSGYVESTMIVNCIILTKDNVYSRMTKHLLIINALKYMLWSNTHLDNTVCSTTDFNFLFGTDGGLSDDNSNAGINANRMASIFSFTVNYKQNYTE